MTQEQCACVMPGEIDQPACFDVAVRKARKRHRCGECGAIIEVGQEYEHAKGLWDGEWGNCKTCLACVRIRDDFCPEGFVYGEVLEAIRE